MAKWTLEEKENVQYYRLEFNEAGFEKLACLFFTRIGGLKFLLEQPDSFNCDIKWVEDNFRIKRINFLRQIHSDKIYYISEYLNSQELLQGDGMFSDQPNLFLSIGVADCLPIYFFIPNSTIIGIVHSGWKGTFNRIGPKLVKLIKEQYRIDSSQIKFAFGPSIGKCCYEIKQDVARKFESLIKEYDIKDAILNHNQKRYLDLKLINRIMLENLGLKIVADIELCSHCNTNTLFSARQDNTAGRNLALIGYYI